MSIIYIILIILAVLLLLFKRDKSRSFQLIGLLFLILVFIVGAFRDASVGTDIELNDDGYHLLWKNPFHYYRDVEPGFMYLTYIIKSLIPSYYAYYSIIFIFTLIFFCASAKKLGVNQYAFVAVIFLSGYLHISFNIIRQMLGISLALYVYSLYYIRTFNKSSIERNCNYIKNTIIYELIILILAMTMHGSILILSIVPIFDSKIICSFLDNDIILFALLGATIFISVIGHNYILMALTLFEGQLGNRADSYISDYLANSESFEAAHGYITSLVNGLIAILISKGRRNKYFFIGFLGILLTEIASSGMGTIGRTFTNLQYFINLYYCQIWFVPIQRKTVYNAVKNIGLKTIRIVFWLSSLYYTLLINETVNPYKSFIFQ